LKKLLTAGFFNNCRMGLSSCVCIARLGEIRFPPHRNAYRIVSERPVASLEIDSAPRPGLLVVGRNAVGDARPGMSLIGHVRAW
jgi:hypothetical protein